VSQSPLEPGSPEKDAEERYAAGWAAINKLMRSGYSWSGREQDCAFLNLRDGRFADVSSVAGFDSSGDERAAAVVDWDFDGDLDLFVTSRTGPRLRYLRNDQATGNSSVSLRLANAPGRTAIGARVELEVDEAGSTRTLTRTLRAGEGYLAQSSTWLVFGLGGAAPLRARVHWPGGSVEEFTGIVAGGFHDLVAGSGQARRWTPPPRTQQLAPSRLEPPAPSARARVVLARAVPMPALTLRTPEQEELSLFGVRPGGGGSGTGRPLLLNLFSRTCEPCAAELSALAARRTELEQSGLSLFAVSVDPPADGEAVRQFLERSTWPYPHAFAPSDAIAVLDALAGILVDSERALPLPTSFLIAPDGDLVALYFGPVSDERASSGCSRTARCSSSANASSAPRRRLSRDAG
jgi:peroxiredoxin